MYPFALHLFILSAVVGYANAILGGLERDWNRNGYLVEVKSWLTPGGDQALRCAGSLITPNVVLTSPHCVKYDGVILEDIMVTIKLKVEDPNPHADLKIPKEEKFGARVANSTDSWALLHIVGPDANELCPPGPSPKGVMQLNLRPSLRERSIVRMEDPKTAGRKCYIYGFDSEEEEPKENSDRRMKKLEIESFKDNQSKYPMVQKGENGTACNSDIGAPLICNDETLGFVQIGFLIAAKYKKIEQLARNKELVLRKEGKNEAGKEEENAKKEDTANAKGTKNKVKNTSNEDDSYEDSSFGRRTSKASKCSDVNEMYFTLFFNDEAFFEALEKLDLPGIAAVYDKCDFSMLKRSLD